MHALEILCSGLHRVAAILLGNVKSELAAILVTVWARAAQGSVQGAGPRWQPQSCPSDRQARGPPLGSASTHSGS